MNNVLSSHQHFSRNEVIIDRRIFLICGQLKSMANPQSFKTRRRWWIVADVGRRTLQVIEVARDYGSPILKYFYDGIDYETSLGSSRTVWNFWDCCWRWFIRTSVMSFKFMIVAVFHSNSDPLFGCKSARRSCKLKASSLHRISELQSFKVEGNLISLNAKLQMQKNFFGSFRKRQED